MKTLFSFFKAHILFFVFLFLALYFLIFQDGFWLYVDTWWWILDRQQYYQAMNNSLSSFSQYTYFWVDMTGILSSRLLQTTFKILPMELYYAIFFIGSYFSMFCLLKIFFQKKASSYWALLYTFNPISLHFLKLVWYLYIYFSVPLILLWIYYFFKTHKFKYLLLLLIWFCFYVSYTRLIGIYLLLFIILSFYFHKNIFVLFKKDKKNILLITICTLLVLWPFLFSLIYPYIDGNKDYFSGVSNFADVFSQRQIGFIERMRNLPMIYSLFPIEILNDFANDWHQTKIFHIISLLFIQWNIVLFLFSKHRKSLDNFILYTLLFFIFFHSSPKFLSNEVMISILHYFPFITNNIHWLYCIYLLLFTYILSYNFTHFYRKKILISSLIVYIFCALFPLLNFENNIKSQLIDIEKMPISYKDTFFTKNNDTPNSLFYPQRNLYIQGNPYHIRIENNLNYSEPFSEDIRVVGEKQVKVSKLLYSVSNIDIFSLFNIKNIFVFRWIQDNNGILDYYSGKNLEQKWEQLISDLKKNDSIFLKEENSDFAYFQIKNYTNYEYFLYSPQSIINSEIDTFFDTEIDIKSRPIVIDSESFKKPEKINKFKIPESNRDIRIDYKQSTRNHTKYFMKISGIDTSEDFLVQLNQTFGMSWKLKWIDEAEYREYSCLDNYEYFPITNNSLCHFEHWYLDSIWDYKYLNYKSIKEENHFEGNFVGNTWLIESDDIRTEDIWKDELYAVIIYEKQTYYMWTLIISLLTFLILMLLSIHQEIKIFLIHKKEKWALSKR